jgi:hypothetical protein
VKYLVSTALVSFVAVAPCRADESFDAAAYEKKALEWKGYGELRPEGQLLRRDSAGYAVQFPDQSRSALARANGAAELSGVLRYEALSLSFTGHADYKYDYRGQDVDGRVYEGYVAWQPSSRAVLEAGKRSLRWGKGYAFNPVAFLDRPKDPTDPELSREGFIMAEGELVRSFDFPLKTLALTALVVPTTWSLNSDFGPPGHVDFATKLYALVLDTDIDLLYAAPGTQGQRFGVDFSRNLGSNLEIHGELSTATGAPRAVLMPADGSGPGSAGTTGALARESRRTLSYLVGLRYLTERESTFIIEYYRNGNGYTEDELRPFFELARIGATDAAALNLATRAFGQGYGRPNAARSYVYFRVAQNEPFDILYLVPALTAIVNTDDGSFSVIPEVTYTRVRNVELRLRFAVNRGDSFTDYGEKPVVARAELRARYYF